MNAPVARHALRGATIFLCLMAAPAFSQDRINVSLGDVSLNKVPFLVAADNGLYEKHGLDVHQFITKNAADRISRSGIEVPADFVGTPEDYETAEITVGGGSPLIVQMTMEANATDRVIVATTDNQARFHIISSPDLDSVEDLKGSRLGYSSFGSVSHLMALDFIRQMGWSAEDDISLMEEGMDFAALKAGNVDAFIGSSIYYGMAEQNGAKDLVDLTAYDIPLAGSGINVERTYLAENRDVVLRFLKAMIESYALMKKDKEVVLAALVKWYGISDPAQQEDMYAQVLVQTEKPYPAEDGIRLVKELFTHRELKRQPAEHFFDASLIAELDQAGFIEEIYAE